MRGLRAGGFARSAYDQDVLRLQVTVDEVKRVDVPEGEGGLEGVRAVQEREQRRAAEGEEGVALHSCHWGV